MSDPEITDLMKEGSVAKVPIRINCKDLVDCLKAKNVQLPDNINKLIEDTKVSCEAFYFTTKEPLLMIFAVTFQKGLIKDLTQDADLEELFDAQRVSVRIVRYNTKEEFDILKQYVAGLE